MFLFILSKLGTNPLNRTEQSTSHTSSIIYAICPSTDRVLHTQLTMLLQQIQGLLYLLLQQIPNVGES